MNKDHTMKKPKTTKTTKTELIESLTARLNLTRAEADAERNLKEQARRERDEFRASFDDATERLRGLRRGYDVIQNERNNLRAANDEAIGALAQSTGEIIKLAIQAAVAEQNFDGTKRAMDRAFADLRDLLRLGDIRISMTDAGITAAAGNITVSLENGSSLPIGHTSPISAEEIEGKRGFAGFMLRLFRSIGSTLQSAGGQSRNLIVNGTKPDPFTEPPTKGVL